MERVLKVINCNVSATNGYKHGIKDLSGRRISWGHRIGCQQPLNQPGLLSQHLAQATASGSVAREPCAAKQLTSTIGSTEIALVQ